MTPQVEKYINSQPINTYRMIDGAIVIAVELEYNDTLVILERPLQYCQNPGVSLIEWMIGRGNTGDGEFIVMKRDIIARSVGSFHDKYLYSRYHLIKSLYTCLDAAEINELLDNDIEVIVTSSVNPLPSSAPELPIESCSC